MATPWPGLAIEQGETLPLRKISSRAKLTAKEE
jgi:hypothetical protein